MKTWLFEWFASHGSVINYLNKKNMIIGDADAVCRMIESDINRGIHRERLLFSIVMLLEWADFI